VRSLGSISGTTADERPRHVLVFARLPVAGRVKSRLASGVGPAAACTFYAACAAHSLRTVDAYAAASDGRVSWSLHFSDVSDADGVRSWTQSLQLAACHSLVAQHGDSLGDRLYTAFEWSVAQPENWASVCVVGTDVPDISSSDLHGESLAWCCYVHSRVTRVQHLSYSGLLGVGHVRRRSRPCL